MSEYDVEMQVVEMIYSNNCGRSSDLTSCLFAVRMSDAEALCIALTRSGVKYPAMMAEGDSEDALKFNCTQRSHQNTLEQLPTFLAMQLLLAQAYPLTAAALGMIWNVGTPERPS